MNNTSIAGMKRTHMCGDLRLEHAGQTVTVNGWVDRVRDNGGVLFLLLRDRAGIVQCTFDKSVNADLFDIAFTCRTEFVVAVKGKLVARDAAAINKKMPTGEVEIIAEDIRILSKAETTPFEIDDTKEVGDQIRLKYRYLDLRRPSMQKNLMLRHRVTQVARNYFDEHGFLEIETPMLTKSTPEGARDYLVPSRVHPGKFYALPQSPQQYKQLLMLSGMDRYIQITRCFRDEDLRADRQPEFTQVDLEMSFVTQEDIMDMLEGYIQRLYREIKGIEIGKMPRLTYREAMERYGSDKPDTRFEMEIVDLSEQVKGTSFPVFADALANGGSVRCIVAKDAAATLTRKAIDKLTEQAKGIGAKGLAYIRWADEKPNCSFAKFMSEEGLTALLHTLGCQQGDVVLIVADKDRVVLPVLGQLRLTLGKQLGLIPEGKYNFLWITEFPFFEWDEESQSWLAMHHPFTMPLEECLPYIDSDPGSVRAQAYDMVVNGVELLSGSIRITDYELQQKMFEALGLTEEEIEAKFGFLVDAYKYGAPPHGGAALGLDRIVMTMCGCDNLRDVVAFPKVQNASELMSQCPSPVDKKSLDELAIAVTEFEKDE